MFYASTVILA